MASTIFSANGPVSFGSIFFAKPANPEAKSSVVAGMASTSLSAPRAVRFGSIVPAKPASPGAKALNW